MEQPLHNLTNAIQDIETELVRAEAERNIEGWQSLARFQQRQWLTNEWLAKFGDTPSPQRTRAYLAATMRFAAIACPPERTVRTNDIKLGTVAVRTLTYASLKATVLCDNNDREAVHPAMGGLVDRWTVIVALCAKEAPKAPNGTTIAPIGMRENNLTQWDIPAGSHTILNVFSLPGEPGGAEPVNPEQDQLAEQIWHAAQDSVLNPELFSRQRREGAMLHSFRFIDPIYQPSEQP